MVYFVLILRLSEIRKTVMKLMDIARAIKARRTIHGNKKTRIGKIREGKWYVTISLFLKYCYNVAAPVLAIVNTDINRNAKKSKERETQSEVNEYESPHIFNWISKQ